MNLAEALNAALPELPARRARVGYPRLDPALIAREQIEDGKPTVVAIIRGRDSFFRFAPDQWKIIELFDGTRSWEDVAALLAESTGVRYDPSDLREFTDGLDEVNFWYRTPLEKNIALQQKLQESRHQHAHRRSKWGDVAHMQFSAWDPDKYFDLIYPWLKWIYTKWFAVVCVVLFGLMACIYVANWGQIGRDTLLFYSFTQKTAGDLLEFWVLFFVLAFFHESAHGLTCKHYGGQVHAMGFHLIYLTPAFFVDVSESLVYANRWERLITILAGIGVEMIFCAVATIVWWGTPPGSPSHDLAYKIMLITGVAVVVVNMNPLIKLDGYYAFTEIIGFSDIKEKSTAYLSGLVKTKLFRLPGEVDFVPKRRRLGYLTYAVLSGTYSYLLLITVVRFCHNVSAKYSPQWALVPALALAALVFRARIRTLLRFMRTVYLDKRDRIQSMLSVPRLAAASAVLLLVVFLPLWHQTITARFLLEPAQFAMVRATVAGRVTNVLAEEGKEVRAGDALLTMVNPHLESASDESRKRLALAGTQRAHTLLIHGDLGIAAQENRLAGTDAAIAGEVAEQLVPRAPFDGVVTAPHLSDLKGSYLGAGSAITGIADMRTMRVLIYVPEFAVGDVRLGAHVSLQLDGSFIAKPTTVERVEAAARDVPPAVETIKQIQGGGSLQDYVVVAFVTNDGSLYDGMTGTAKIAVRRTSLAAMAWREIRDFVDGKLW